MVWTCTEGVADSDYIGRRTLRLELAGRRIRRRPKRRLDGCCERGCVILVGVSEEDAEIRVRWRQTISCSTFL